MTNYRALAPMKYWAAPASMEPEKFDTRLQAIVASGDYVYAEKIDGNLSRAIVGEPDPILQTRGISVKTDTFGEIQDKVLWWDDVAKAFDKTTVIVGEVYIDGGVDRDVGSVLRSLPDKAIKRQKKNPLKWYVFDVLCYEGMELQDEPLSTRISYIEKVVARIGNPLVRGATYKTATPDNFFAELDAILARGGEGVVLSNKELRYEFDKRASAWSSIKVKRKVATADLSATIDCFIIGTVPPTKEYTGKEMGEWQYWYDERTNERLQGTFFSEYQNGTRHLTPVSKNWFHKWCGAINVGVYDNQGNIYPLCSVAGLTDDLKQDISANYAIYDKMPLSISGMEITIIPDKNGKAQVSVRHPVFKCLRAEDISPEDCTLEKIIGG